MLDGGSLNALVPRYQADCGLDEEGPIPDTWVTPQRQTVRRSARFDAPNICSYIKRVRITCDPAKRQRTLMERGVDMRRAKEVFAGVHFTRADDRFDYGEP